MSTNPFVLERNQYKRDISPVKHYVEQAAHFLSVSTGKDIKECTNYVKRALRSKKLGNIRDPKVEYLARQDNGDRVREETTLTRYIGEAIRNRYILAPTYTCYCHPKEKQSLLVEFVEANIKARSKLKKAAFAAKAAGDLTKAAIDNLGQTNKKLSNNSLSGAHVSNSTPLYNPSAHPSLTSNCRVSSGYGNANNEKLMCGNRHYWSPNVVINNINSIIYLTDAESFQAVLNKYNLHIPTYDEVMECILYSTDLYWIDKTHEHTIRQFVLKLNDWQRAAFVYTGDLYHIKKHNDAFMREFFRKLSTKAVEVVEDPLSKIDLIHEDYMNLAHQICSVEMLGKGKNYKAMEGTQELQTLVATGLNIHKVVDDYADFIKAIFVTDNMPASVGYFPSSIRRAALTSDTDSTIFTVQDWVKWYQGHIDITPESNAISATAIFLASQGIVHLLAKMSANFGVEEKRIFQTAMKNEFKFDVFVPTQVAKHYYASISCQEGNILSKPDIEIKGVHLKNSNIPVFIMRSAENLMKEIMDHIVQNKKISMRHVLKWVGDEERKVFDLIHKGSTVAFTVRDIKQPEAYKNPESSPYQRHLFWKETFGTKYGTPTSVPYRCISVDLELNNPTEIKDWLDNMDDKELSQRLGEYFARTQRKNFKTIYIPISVTEVHGIPKEILAIINSRQMVSKLCYVFYLILETLGIHMLNKKVTHLVSDDY